MSVYLVNDFFNLILDGTRNDCGLGASNCGDASPGPVVNMHQAVPSVVIGAMDHSLPNNISLSAVLDTFNPPAGYQGKITLLCNLMTLTNGITQQEVIDRITAAAQQAGVVWVPDYQIPGSPQPNISCVAKLKLFDTHSSQTATMQKTGQNSVAGVIGPAQNMVYISSWDHYLTCINGGMRGWYWQAEADIGISVTAISLVISYLKSQGWAQVA